MAPAGLALGTFGADFVSGLLHWAFDTWFDETIEPLRRMVYMVREHHMRPARVLRYRLRDEAGILSWFAVALAGPIYISSHRAPDPPTGGEYGRVLAAFTMANELVLMLEFHKWGHRARRGRLPRVLQRCRLLLSPDVHLVHHSGNHDQNYCLITGVADRTISRLGAFRGLEWAVTACTRVAPRTNDREWALRYGRPA